MYKVTPIYHAGQALIPFSGLPAVQFEYLDNHVPEMDRFSLTIDDENMGECIRYDVYEHWYQLISLTHYEKYLESQF